MCMRGLELESVAEGVGMKIMGQEEFQALAIFDPDGAKKRLDLF